MKSKLLVLVRYYFFCLLLKTMFAHLKKENCTKHHRYFYLACQPDRYGLNCAKPCGPNCQGCNRFTGVCEFGCLPGWKGIFCEERSITYLCNFCDVM